MRTHEYSYALNAGGVDPEAIGRIDLEKMRIAGEHPVKNLLPRVLGPSTLRPGTEMLEAVPGNVQVPRMIRFWKDDDDAAYQLAFAPGQMFVLYQGAVQRVPSVSTVIPTTWTDASEVGASITSTSGLLLEAGDGAEAIARVAVSVAGADQGVAHVIRLVVTRGPVILKAGTSVGGNQYFSDVDQVLYTGTHKIAVTPTTGTLHLQISATDTVDRTLSSVSIEPAGVLSLPTPWSSVVKIKRLRWWQSLDILYVGDGTEQPQEIQHRGPLSWSVVAYETDTGPYFAGASTTLMTPGAISGNTTITASKPSFKAGHVGALLELTHVGRTIDKTLDELDEATDYITVVGVDRGRWFYITATGSSFVGTLVLERSFEPTDPVSWSTHLTWVDGAATFTRTVQDDGQDNATAHYRFRVSAYTSGSVTVQLDYDSDVQAGRSRVVAYNSSTSVDVEVLVPFGRTVATRQWRIGAWNGFNGWPRVPIIHDGRLHWFKGDADTASYPDEYYDFDTAATGDGAPFQRSVGLGGESEVRWALSVERLLVGTARSEAVIAASEFDGPLTQLDYTVRRPSRRGSMDLEAIEHDDGAFFVQRAGNRVYEISMVTRGTRFDTTDMSRINPKAYRAGVVGHAVQQQPDTRHHAVLADGTEAVLTYDRRDEVMAITTIEIDGATIECNSVLPSVGQDDVYLVTRRNGVRYFERLAPEADQMSTATCALLDGHKVLTGSVSAISGATWFANQTVQVWADGQRRADVTLDGSGNASLGATYSRVVYGKRFSARYQSVKLAHAARLGTAIGQTKIIHGAAVVLHKSCLDGIQIGPDSAHLVPMPKIVNGAVRTTNQFFENYDHEVVPLNATWDPDARFVVEIDSAEGPVTIQGIVLDVETRDGASE